MHCFTGCKNFAKKLLDYNTYFSASGIINLKIQQNYKIHSQLFR